LDKRELNRGTIVDFIRDIFDRRGSDSYLGETITMSQHMLQAALNAEQAGESSDVITAALLHDIGHFTSEFPDDFVELGIDNFHQHAGAAILERFFNAAVTEPVRWHVDAKRYLCAVEPEYFASLSDASVKTLKFQGGPFDEDQLREFEKRPHYKTALRVRRYDDKGKVPGKTTPDFDYYLSMVQEVLEESVK
jgi:phosphonate degradation associated HDIG domain protein